MAALETRVETMAKAHNEVVTHATQLKKHLLNLELEMEELSNRSRRYNFRIRGLREAPNEGPLAQTLEYYFKNIVPDVPDDQWTID
ncbi:Hypothetical predicted protein [Pelobates cultripes]|uniref:Uncharacterized protein n=1 Tax=Pelobates cultripes TaxID=61616 RepID=A0AAD1SW30_PELCU|nr:Hypothetical predicted protein [Pelobates cultripes]